MTIGEKIRLISEQLGLEQGEFADKLGVKQSAMSHYMNDKRKVDRDLLQNIVDMFNVNPGFFFDETEPMFSTERTYTDTIPNHISTIEQAREYFQNQVGMLALFGGYDFSTMSDEDIIELANLSLEADRIAMQMEEIKQKRRK